MKKISLLSTLVAAISLLFSQAGLAASHCDEIHLGSAISLTGKYATNGIHAKNGYEFAIKKIAENGGVKFGGKCYNFRVTYYDDESKGDRGATLAERLINQDKVQYMLGPYSSGLTKAIAPVTEKYKIPMVEAEGASRSLFNKGYKYLFAVLSTSEQYLASAVSLAAEVAEKNGKKASDVKVAVAVPVLVTVVVQLKLLPNSTVPPTSLVLLAIRSGVGLVISYSYVARTLLPLATPLVSRNLTEIKSP